MECKSTVTLQETSVDAVLISTYWNVNIEEKAKEKESNSFNLNLLECKFLTISKTFYHQRCFNLNLLECKYILEAFADAIPNSFNLNLLECKLLFCRVFQSGCLVLISTYWNVNRR